MENLLQVVLLGIIEGITEFLPISSTGHLLIAEHWLGRRSDLFNVAIQAGAILAVVVIYRRRLWELAVHFSRTENRSYVYKLAAAVAITVVGGFVAKQAGLALPDTVAPIAWALILSGLAIFAIEAYARRQPPSEVLTWKVAFWVGMGQIHAAVFLMDIDPERLRVAERMTHKVAAALSARPTVTTHRDRRSAVADADYVINTIQVGGYRPATVIDFETPTRHRLRQTIGDTLGVGGIMRALRTIPVLLELCRDMEAVCPDACLLNYTNPMAMNCWALARRTPIRTVGLCHSVQGTARQLAQDVGVPYAEVSYLAAGINHMAFYLRFERDLFKKPLITPFPF